MIVKATHRSRTTRPRNAGSSARTTHSTELRCGSETETIIWSLALLRRLAALGKTTAEYTTERARALSKCDEITLDFRTEN